MRDCDEHQDGSADDEREHTDIEEKSAGRGDATEQRQFGICKVRGQEGVSENAGGSSHNHCQQEVEAHPTPWHYVKTSSHTHSAASHILQDECCCHGYAG